MPYPTTPKTWVAGDVLTAAQLNAELRDALLGAFPLRPDVAWTAYTPVFGAVTLGTGSTVDGAYTKIGRLVLWRARCILGTGGVVTGAVTVTLPVNCATPSWYVQHAAIYEDVTANMIIGGFEYLPPTQVRLLAFESSSAYVGRALLAAGIPFVWAVNDQIRVQGYYEATT